MARAYLHLNEQDRVEIRRLLAEGRSARQVALELGRAPSTIIREIRRDRYLASLIEARDAKGLAAAPGRPGQPGQLGQSGQATQQGAPAALRTSGASGTSGARGSEPARAPQTRVPRSGAARAPQPRRRHQPVVSQPPADRDLARVLRVPGSHDHKYTRGVVGVWAGSHAYPGAAVLVTSAAVRAGAGLVRLLAPERVEDLVLAARPEVVAVDGRSQALVIGPGTDPADGPRASALAGAIRRGVTSRLPIVLDAGALALLPCLLRGDDGAAALTLTPRQVLTPHAGEAAALLSGLGVKCDRSRVEIDPALAASELVRLTGATVVLKGTPTMLASVVDEPVDGEDDVRVWALDSGPGWLATAGSGDVLAGIMGAVLAGVQADVDRQADSQVDRGASGGAELDPAVCAALAVRLHALAGWAAAYRAAGREVEDGVGAPFAALDLTEVLASVIGRLLDAVRAGED